MRTLIIVAHPMPDSFSHKLAAAYQDGAGSAGHSVELLDLYASHDQLGFLRPESHSEYRDNQPVRQKWQAKILAADEVVFIHPLWWGGPPAILKNFIDQVFTPGFAYHHPRPKLHPRINLMTRRLLKGKQARVMITCNGQRWTNALRLMPYFLIWYFYVFRYVGFRPASFQLFDFMKHRGALQRARWLAKVRNMAARKAADI
ncbi:MAG: flavodoxin family protein [Candidatus Chaera renei]|uniref:Flavodoxin family protein n=1 Tax=Candidatus Chaera renei TaxID=2506947 RepID=A0A4Q0AJ10_9BACT|nr:MAG: flavodoxin family protein [Candidatus Chaera renei]